MGQRYKNRYVKHIKRTPIHILKWFLGGYKETDYKKQDFLGYKYPQKPNKKKQGIVTWINHCTFLIEYMGVTLLTDPIFSKRASPVQFFGPKRRHEPGINLEDLKKIDVVMISHNHYDHLDVRSVKALVKKHPHILWIIPKGLGRWFSRRAIDNFIELEWEQHVDFQFNDRIKIRFFSTSAQHYSGRGLFDKNKTLWMGIVSQFFDQGVEKKSLYFVGDSAYNPFEFRKIGKRFKGFDLMLCPIGTYHPIEFMKTVHMSPSQAVKVHMQVRSKQSVGMHFKTFHLSDEGVCEPIYDLYHAMKKEGLDTRRFVALDPGETLFW